MDAVLVFEGVAAVVAGVEDVDLVAEGDGGNDGGGGVGLGAQVQPAGGDDVVLGGVDVLGADAGAE